MPEQRTQDGRPLHWVALEVGFGTHAALVKDDLLFPVPTQWSTFILVIPALRGMTHASTFLTERAVITASHVRVVVINWVVCGWTHRDAERWWHTECCYHLLRRLGVIGSLRRWFH